MKMMGPLDYVKRGWHIFPVHGIFQGKCTCGKNHDRDNQMGKHPITRNGVKDATTDVHMIQTWMQTYSRANWAVACGRLSNLLVVDIDQRKNGFVSLDQWEQERPDGALPDTLKATSGGGGRHLFFEYPTDGLPVSNRVTWLQGVDIRSDGGYIILPYGTHVSGGRYSWVNDETNDPVPPPSDLLASIRTTLSASADRDYSIDAATILQGVPEGRRDHTLFLAACSLRRKLGDDQRAAVEIIIKAAAANCDPPFPEADALRKVEQAWRQDHSDEITEWGFINSKGQMFHNLTDKGNKERFVENLSENFRYVPGWGWLEYGITGWERVGVQTVLHTAEGVASVVREEIPLIDDNSMKMAWRRHALKCEASGSISAIANLAENDPRLNLKIEDFDSDSYSLGCRNGIVDLRTGELRPFTRDEFMTKNTGVLFDLDYSIPQWEQFLDAATGSDKTLIKYLQMAAGYTLTGLVAEECFFVLSGPTASGKSTFVDALLAMCGTYGLTTQSETFMYRRNKETARNELARLVGMRLVAMSEVREGEAFDEAIVKQFTGGDRVSARFLYQDTFEFTPQMKLWIATNHDPAAREKALMRRIKRIMFPYTVPPEKRSSKLKSMLKDPEVGGRAVLAWAVRGAIEYFEAGRLIEPAQVQMAVEEYEQANDTFSHFIEENLVRESGCHLGLQMAYDLYRIWCSNTNEYTVRRPQFKKRLEDAGFRMTRSGKIDLILDCRQGNPTGMWGV